jgi:hypothetical protein
MMVSIMVERRPVSSSTALLLKVILWMRSAVDTETVTPSVGPAHVRRASLDLAARTSPARTAMACCTHLIQPMRAMDVAPVMWKLEAVLAHSRIMEKLVRNPSVLKTAWVWVAAMLRLESVLAQKGAVAQRASSKTVQWTATLLGMATAID